MTLKLYFLKGIGPYRKGQTKNVPEKLGRFYVKNGIAELVSRDNTYQTKVMVAEKPTAPVQTQTSPNEPEVVEDEPDSTEPADDLDGLDAEELRAIAELRGVKVHHNAGVEKIKETLRSAEKSV